MAKMNKQQLRAMLDASNATEGRLRGVIGMLNIKLTELENETRLVVDSNHQEVLVLRAQVLDLTGKLAHRGRGANTLSSSKPDTMPDELNRAKAAVALYSKQAVADDIRHKQVIAQLERANSACASYSAKLTESRTEAQQLRTKLVASINKANAKANAVDDSTSALRLMAQIQMTDTALHIATKEVRRLEAELAASTLAVETVTGELRDLKNDNMIRCEQLIVKRPSWWPL